MLPYPYKVFIPDKLCSLIDWLSEIMLQNFTNAFNIISLLHIWDSHISLTVEGVPQFGDSNLKVEIQLLLLNKSTQLKLFGGYATSMNAGNYAAL